MDRKFAAVYFVGVLSLLGGVLHYLSHREYEVKISEEQILQKLSERLPITKNYWLVFDITLSNPRVSLVDGSNRIAAGLNILIRVVRKDITKTYQGSLDISGGVKYVQSVGSFFLTGVNIDQVEIQGMPDHYKQRIQELLKMVVDEYCQTHPVYTLDPHEHKQAMARYFLKDVVIDHHQVIAKLGM